MCHVGYHVAVSFPVPAVLLLYSGRANTIIAELQLAIPIVTI